MEGKCITYLQGFLLFFSLLKMGFSVAIFCNVFCYFLLPFYSEKSFILLFFEKIHKYINTFLSIYVFMYLSINLYNSSYFIMKSKESCTSSHFNTLNFNKFFRIKKAALIMQASSMKRKWCLNFKPLNLSLRKTRYKFGFIIMI